MAYLCGDVSEAARRSFTMDLVLGLAKLVLSTPGTSSNTFIVVGHLTDLLVIVERHYAIRKRSKAPKTRDRVASLKLVVTTALGFPPLGKSTRILQYFVENKAVFESLGKTLVACSVRGLKLDDAEGDRTEFRNVLGYLFQALEQNMEEPLGTFAEALASTAAALKPLTLNEDDRRALVADFRKVLEVVDTGLANPVTDDSGEDMSLDTSFDGVGGSGTSSGTTNPG